MIGPSTTQTPYLVGTAGNVTFTSILSAGDTVPGSFKSDGTPFREVGVPDGLGAFDNGDGTFTLLVNHEIGPTVGAVRAHGSVGAFVERLVIDKATLQVKSAGDLGQTVFTFNSTTGSYVQGTTAFARLCSADLADVSAFFDAASGLGTQSRIFLNGEENGSEGRGFAWIATGPEAGRVYELPKTGKFSWENLVASPDSGRKTVAIGTDDATPGQLYLYAGDKQATGNEIEKAGLTNGKLFGIKVAAFATETNATTVGAAGTAFTLQEMGPNGDVSRFTGAQLQAESTAEGVTEFLRPEDGSWDPTNANRFYFATTNSTSGPSRLWALEFTDGARPELGGVVKQVLKGTEGQVMFDNLTVTDDGRVILQEDVGNNARLGKVWSYDPATGALTQLGEHDPARFSLPTAPFTQDEESSGVIDVSDILGSPGKQVFLLDVQAHYPFGQAEIVEGGQILAMTVDRTLTGTSGADILTGTQISDLILGREGDDRLSSGVGNDVIDGGFGNDIITGGPGNDTLIGGPGTDRAIFSYALSAARVNASATGVVTITGPDGSDTVRGIEQFVFSDRTIDNADGSPLVDDLFYLSRNPDVAASNQDADAHYAAFGFREGRDPNALFSTTGYLAANSDVRAAGVNPLAHYDTNGFREGRDPGASFDNEFYLARNADVRAAGLDPLAHYLEVGQSEGRAINAAIGRASDISGGFDAEFYLLSNADVARAAIAAGGDGFAFARQHFNAFGAQEGRDPNAIFDTDRYLAAYSDVRAAGINPLTHYDQFGYREGRDPSVSFDTTAYLAANADVRAAGIDPMQHYLQFGLYEGRSAQGDATFGFGAVG